jgi:glycosyltransferase involved in cell wall biosynthesis
LYFTRDYTPHDHRFLSALAGTDHEIFFLRLERGYRQVEDRVLPERVQVVSWRGGRAAFRWRDLLALVFDVRRVVRQIKPDVVHAGPVQLGAFMAALAGCKPLVTMSWGSDLLKDADRSWLYRWLTRFTLSRSTVLVGDCQAVRRKAESLGLSPGRVFLFPWGVDLSHFSPAGGSTELSSSAHPIDLRSRLGWQDAFVLLSLRSWEPIYGVDVVVRAFAMCAQEMPDLRLVLLGGGSQASWIQSFLQQHALHSQVYLGGQVNQLDLPAIYRAADLYLSASHSDGSSVSLMEALACGKPVLVSDIPGNREWISQGVEGWLFPDGDASSLAEGIRRASRQRRELSLMGQAARRLAEKRADWRKNFQVLLQAYQSAVERNR